MISEVLSYPIWSDCPFRGQVPDEITIRKGMKFETAIVIFSIEAGEGPYREVKKHVAFSADMLKKEGIVETLLADLAKR